MRDFASFLDEPPSGRAAEQQEPFDDSLSAPSIPFGFVAGDAAGPADGRRAEFAGAYLGLNAEGVAGELPPDTTPEAIARELGLYRVADIKSLDRLRREFAFRNHPDRVTPAWRDLAMARMQTANRLIDEARQRLAGKRT